MNTAAGGQSISFKNLVFYESKTLCRSCVDLTCGHPWQEEMHHGKQGEPLWIASQQNIGSPACHARGNGEGPRQAGLGDDLGLSAGAVWSSIQQVDRDAVRWFSILYFVRGLGISGV
jgi:hypothetical protein